MVCVCVPCIPQENNTSAELLPLLEHVRPGGGFKPKYHLTEKVEVNGAGADPLWKFLRASIPMPADQSTDDCPIMPKTTGIIWEPITKSDIEWNFAKFVCGKDGVPAVRYSPKFEFKDLVADIDRLLAVDLLG